MKSKLLFQICLFFLTAQQGFAQISNLGTNTLTSGGAAPNQAAAPIIDPLPLPPNAIVFDYDNAGNQIRRRFIYVASVAPRLATPIPTDTIAVAKIAEDKLLPTDLYEEIKYYPNPVKTELYLQWSEIDNNDLQTIDLYDLNGRLIKSYPNQSSHENAIINFESYPAGYYNLILIYSSGVAKNLKIVKQ